MTSQQPNQGPKDVCPEVHPEGRPSLPSRVVPVASNRVEKRLSLPPRIVPVENPHAEKRVSLPPRILPLGNTLAEQPLLNPPVDESPVENILLEQNHFKPSVYKLPVERTRTEQSVDELPVESTLAEQCLLKPVVDELPVESALAEQPLDELLVVRTLAEQCRLKPPVDELSVESTLADGCLLKSHVGEKKGCVEIQPEARPISSPQKASVPSFEGGANFQPIPLVEPPLEDSNIPVEGRLSISRNQMKLPVKTPMYSGLLGEYRRQFHTIDSDGSGSMSEAELFGHVKACIEKSSSQLTPELESLLKEEVRQRYEEIALGVRDGLSSSKWVHYRALRSTAPAYNAVKSLNKRLLSNLEFDPSLLRRIHTAFQAADEQGDGRLSPCKIVEALAQLQVPPTHIREFDTNRDNQFDYFEFLNLALQIDPSEISLAYYDLSKGFAPWIPLCVTSGHKFEGVWHTSVLAFDEEWWYGGRIFASELGTTPFGQPTKVEKLGLSMRTKDELIEFCVSELCGVFTARSYDIFHNNCNCFSNEIIQFLLRGKQIPDEVRMQPVWVKSSALIQTLRPTLNAWLGGFGDDNFINTDSVGCRKIDDMANEWRRRVGVGDVVLHRKRYIDRPHVARIMQISVVDRQRCATIVMFRPTGAAWTREEQISNLGELWEWRIDRQEDVSVTELWPCFSVADVTATHLQANHANDECMFTVLKRDTSRPNAPTCTLGHKLGPIHTSWFGFAPPCSICDSHVRVETNWGCDKCSFQMCASCMSLGMEMKGGGAFTDVMNHELAEELLSHPAFLRYKAQCYYFRANDNNDARGLGHEQMLRVSLRLKAELQVKLFINSSPDGTKDPKEAERWDVEKFEDIFTSIMQRSVSERRKELLANWAEAVMVHSV